MWATILFYATFVLELIFKVFIGTGSLQEDLKGRPGALGLHD